MIWGEEVRSIKLVFPDGSTEEVEPSADAVLLCCREHGVSKFILIGPDNKLIGPDDLGALPKGTEVKVIPVEKGGA